MPTQPPRHKAQKPATSRQHDANPRLRGRKGVEQRKRRLARTDYLCEMCRDQGVTRLADEVDHIKPLALGGKDVDSNTRNLCREHHLQVTAEAFGHRARIEIGEDGWPQHST